MFSRHFYLVRVLCKKGNYKSEYTKLILYPPFYVLCTEWPKKMYTLLAGADVLKCVYT